MLQYIDRLSGLYYYNFHRASVFYPMFNECSKIGTKEAIDTKHSNIPGNYQFQNSVFLSFSGCSDLIFCFNV